MKMKVIKENENQNIIWHYSCIFYNMPGAWIWFVSGQNRKCSNGTKAYAFNGKLDGDNHSVSGKFALQEKGPSCFMVLGEKAQVENLQVRNNMNIFSNINIR